MQDLMKGKRGLIMGIANDHSIAWGIAKSLAAQGAELAFTYQGEAQAKRLKPLVQPLGFDRRCDAQCGSQFFAATPIGVHGLSSLADAQLAAHETAIKLFADRVYVERLLIEQARLLPFAVYLVVIAETPYQAGPGAADALARSQYPDLLGLLGE